MENKKRLNRNKPVGELVLSDPYCQILAGVQSRQMLLLTEF